MAPKLSEQQTADLRAQLTELADQVRSGQLSASSIMLFLLLGAAEALRAIDS